MGQPGATGTPRPGPADRAKEHGLGLIVPMVSQGQHFVAQRHQRRATGVPRGGF